MGILKVAIHQNGGISWGGSNSVLSFFVPLSVFPTKSLLRMVHSSRQLNRTSVAAWLLYPQKNTSAASFHKFTHTQPQPKVYEDIRHLLWSWNISFSLLMSKSLWFYNLLFLLGPLFWNEASPTRSQEHPK